MYFQQQFDTHDAFADCDLKDIAKIKLKASKTGYKKLNELLPF